MLDLKLIVENTSLVEDMLANRKHGIKDLKSVLSLYKSQLHVRSRVRTVTKEKILLIEKRRNSKGSKIHSELDFQINDLEREMKTLNRKICDLDEQMNETLKWIPNLIHHRTPIGNEKNNLVVDTFGIKRDFAFIPSNHLEIGSDLKIIDFDSAFSTIGPRHYYLINDGVLLELALINYTFSKLINCGFTPYITPDIAKVETLEKIGFKCFGSDRQVFSIEDTDLCLIATAEITLGALMSDKIKMYTELPILLAGLSHCFRTESTSLESNHEGLFRVHQFSKVEMFAFTTQNESEIIHQKFLEIQKEIYKELGLHFRVVELASENLDGTSYRKFDLEAWMPGQGKFMEITSTSNCLNYQSRRLNSFYIDLDGNKTLMHTINGTACAVTRVLMAILENNQQKDGSIIIPESLRPFMFGKEIIVKKNS